MRARNTRWIVQDLGLVPAGPLDADRVFVST